MAWIVIKIALYAGAAFLMGWTIVDDFRHMFGKRRTMPLAAQALATVAFFGVLVSALITLYWGH